MNNHLIKAKYKKVLYQIVTLVVRYRYYSNYFRINLARVIKKGK